MFVGVGVAKRPPARSIVFHQPAHEQILLYILIEAGYHFVFVMHAGIRNAFLVAFELAVIDISAQVIILGGFDEIDISEG